MFGYVNINRNELSDENKKIYQGYYCGLCQKLKEVSGRKGQMLLNYDMTFLVVLLTGLYERIKAQILYVHCIRRKNGQPESMKQQNMLLI